MCVIIDRQPGVDISENMLEIACTINKDGYGLAFAEKGKIIVHRSLGKNEPTDVKLILDKYKDKRVFLHLRHATVGEVSEINSHPFIVNTVKKLRKKPFE